MGGLSALANSGAGKLPLAVRQFTWNERLDAGTHNKKHPSSSNGATAGDQTDQPRDMDRQMKVASPESRNLKPQPPRLPAGCAGIARVRATAWLSGPRFQATISQPSREAI